MCVDVTRFCLSPATATTYHCPHPSTARCHIPSSFFHSPSTPAHSPGPSTNESRQSLLGSMSSLFVRRHKMMYAAVGQSELLERFKKILLTATDLAVLYRTSFSLPLFLFRLSLSDLSLSLFVFANCILPLICQLRRRRRMLFD